MANEMRDRLVELLNETFDKQYTKSVLITAEHTADHILEDGWIRPPCKVGDTVFFIRCCTTAEEFGKRYVDFGEVLQLSFNAFGEWLVLTNQNLFGADKIFLTKEQAEQKLKEMRGG